MPFSAHASACAILAFADGGSRNSSLHPPQEALGISTLAQGSREVRSVAALRPLHRGAEIRTSFASAQPCTGELRSALRKATVMRTKILSVTPLNPLGVTAPLMNKGSQEARSVAALRPLHRGAKKRTQFALQRTGSRGRSRAVHRFAAVALPFQDVPRPAAHLRFSCAGGALHTPKGCFMCRRHA